MRGVVIAAALGLMACSNAGAEEWRVVGDQSRVSFVSVKAGEIAEVHHFPTLTGGVAEDGAARVQIPLDAVETLIEIRNERMREHLFETETYPLAEVSAALDLAAFDDLEIGARRAVSLPATLDLHGAQIDIEPTVYVTRASDTRVVVETVDPVVVYADDFGFAQGLATLQELAGLPSITPAVPVTFSVMFERAG